MTVTVRQREPSALEERILIPAQPVWYKSPYFSGTNRTFLFRLPPHNGFRERTELSEHRACQDIKPCHREGRPPAASRFRTSWPAPAPVSSRMPYCPLDGPLHSQAAAVTISLMPGPGTHQAAAVAALLAFDQYQECGTPHVTPVWDLITRTLPTESRASALAPLVGRCSTSFTPRWRTDRSCGRLAILPGARRRPRPPESCRATR